MTGRFGTMRTRWTGTPSTSTPLAEFRSTSSIRLPTSMRACSLETIASSSAMWLVCARPMVAWPTFSGNSWPRSGPAVATRVPTFLRELYAVAVAGLSGPWFTTAAEKPDPIGASPMWIDGSRGSSAVPPGGATARVTTSPAPTSTDRAGSDSAMWRATSAAVAVESAVTTMSVGSAPSRTSVSLTFIHYPSQDK